MQTITTRVPEAQPCQTAPVCIGDDSRPGILRPPERMRTTSCQRAARRAPTSHEVCRLCLRGGGHGTRAQPRSRDHRRPATLTKRACAGDRAARAEVLDRHGALVWGLCRRFAAEGSPAEQADRLAGASVVRSWAATVNGTADWRPILGEAPDVPGFFLNLFPWMGFTAAPAVSEAIADLALGLRPRIDLAGFCL